MKAIMLIVTGLLLMLQGLWMESASIVITDNALFRPLRKGEELPAGREDLYFGPDPAVRDMPQMKSQLRIACTLGAVGYWDRNIGIALMAFGAMTGACRYLRSDPAGREARHG